MGRTRTIFIALGCSTALHGVGLELYARYGAVLQIPRLATVATKRPPELVLSIDPVMLDFGEATGTGIALNKSEGEHPQEAREADENQAYLDRRQVGNSPDGNGQRLMPQVGDAVAAAMQPAPASPMTLPTEPVKPTDIKPDAIAMASLPPPPPMIQATPELDAPKAATSIAVSPDPSPPATPVLPSPAPTPQSAPPTPQPSPRVQTAAGHTGAPPVAGAMVPHSESDSDPFMRLSGSVVFKSGRLDVQLGRRVTTVRPQLGIGGITDAWVMAAPSLVVEAHIDPAGRVTEVDLPKKTGSAAIDEPTRNAVYQWVFEPTRDKQGRAIADVIFFEIDYR